MQNDSEMSEQHSVHSYGLSDGQEHHLLLAVDALNSTHNTLTITVDSHSNSNCTERLSYLNNVQMGGYFYLGGVETPERLPWTVASRFGFLGYFTKYGCIYLYKYEQIRVVRVRVHLIGYPALRLALRDQAKQTKAHAEAQSAEGSC